MTNPDMSLRPRPGETPADVIERVTRAAKGPTIVRVVFDMETGGAPIPLGTYWRTDEDTVLYFDPDGEQKAAPEDCVLVVAVEVSR